MRDYREALRLGLRHMRASPGLYRQVLEDLKQDRTVRREDMLMLARTFGCLLPPGTRRERSHAALVVRFTDIERGCGSVPVVSNARCSRYVREHGPTDLRGAVRCAHIRKLRHGLRHIRSNPAIGERRLEQLDGDYRVGREDMLILARTFGCAVPTGATRGRSHRALAYRFACIAQSCLRDAGLLAQAMAWALPQQDSKGTVDAVSGLNRTRRRGSGDSLLRDAPAVLAAGAPHSCLVD